MTCKNVCEKFKSTKSLRGSYYAEGNKRCQVCEVFIKWNGKNCPCCRSNLRTKPRNVPKLPKLSKLD
ncbi:MAG: hypothetical protein EHM25_14105 [Nitrosopumilales archaeon]|nr:MAG: hypothetical protein EHM25_14105 [Nitrosopumilales archaeon]